MSNLTSGHLALPGKEKDVGKDGFRDIVRTNRFSVFNRWSYDNPEKPNWRVSLGGRYLYENREGEGDSWIYILSNKTMPNLVKIGFTGITPEKRAEQLSRGTGVPTKFTVEYAFKCFNAHALESEIHKHLHSYRVSNDREFFQIPLVEAKEAVNFLGKRYI